jgi:hypothetical protein
MPQAYVGYCGLKMKLGVLIGNVGSSDKSNDLLSSRNTSCHENLKSRLT